MLSASEIKELAKQVAKELKKGELLVSPNDIALMFGYAPNSTAIRQILEDPSFPAPVPLLEKGYRRYLRSDVEAWVQKKREEQSRLAFQTSPFMRQA